MGSAIRIKEILRYLDDHDVTYYFDGNEQSFVEGYSSLFRYKKDSMTFVSSLNKFSEYEEQFQKEPINLVLISTDEQIFPCFKNTLQIKEPKKVFFNIIEDVFRQTDRKKTRKNIAMKDNYPHSFVSNDAIIGENVEIGYGCVIESGVSIGENTIIEHNVVIKEDVKIGRNCTIHSGVVIGESGFNPFKNKDRSRTLIKHYGGVEIQNNVHIGANTVISKGTIDDTLIEDGVKINKLANIAHNVMIGRNTVITAPTFVCGSVVIGKNCHIGAHVIKNQRTVKDNAYIGLGAVVINDVEENTVVIGNPAKELKKGAK